MLVTATSEVVRIMGFWVRRADAGLARTAAANAEGSLRDRHQREIDSARVLRDLKAVARDSDDGEAIVAGYHYWGTEVLSRLRGMFAFALWDTVRHELFCARDPFGIKPLFMATGAGGTAVASETVITACGTITSMNELE